MLELAADAVQPSVFDKPCARLVVAEGDIRIETLPADRKHPVEVARTGVVARFAVRGDLLDLGGEVLRDVERSEQRCADDQLVAQGRSQQQRKPAVGRRLILDGAAHDQILVAVAPVGRQDLHQAVYAFGDEEEAQVAARADHLPRLGAPCVGLFDQKIRREAGVDHLSGRNLEPSVAAPAHGQVERRGFTHLAAVLVVPFVLPVYVAVAAAFADLAASVPRVPSDRHDPLSQLHAQAHHVAALYAVFENRSGVVLPEVVFVDAAADETAPFVQGDLSRADVSRADFEQSEPRIAGRSYGMLQ